MSDYHPVDGERVAFLLKVLRQRTPEEITAGVMALAGSFTREMWRALELLQLERSQKERRRLDAGARMPTVD